VPKCNQTIPFPEQINIEPAAWVAVSRVFVNEIHIYYYNIVCVLFLLLLLFLLLSFSFHVGVTYTVISHPRPEVRKHVKSAVYWYTYGCKNPIHECWRETLTFIRTQISFPKSSVFVFVFCIQNIAKLILYENVMTKYIFKSKYFLINK